MGLLLFISGLKIQNTKLPSPVIYIYNFIGSQCTLDFGLYQSVVARRHRVQANGRGNNHIVVISRLRVVYSLAC